jgi:predicted alpha/beta-hydrolase family hydrolase
MSGNNGQVVMVGADVGGRQASILNATGVSKIGLALLPTTPVPFTGDTAWLAWARLLGYSAVAYLAWGKAKPLAYIGLAAAGVSVATSLSAKGI